jgi:hypothetical protein
VESLVGCGNAIMLASKYDAKVVISLLMVCFEWLNPSTITTNTTFDDVGLEVEKNMFREETSIEESSRALITGELFLFRRLSISSSTCAYLLTWWHMHEG